MATKKVNLRLEDYVRGIEGLRPEEQLTLIEIISVKLKKLLRQKKPSHSIMELEGLGAHIWKGMDAQRYVNEERKSWGWIEEFRGQKICLDTSPIIYFIEKDSKYWNLVRPVFIEISLGNIEAITSTLTLLEVLVHPFRNGNEDLAEKYREILLSSEGLTTFEILHETSELAARLRAKYSIKTPDAIQIAVGVRNGASKFLTNDSSLKKISENKVCVLEDYLVK